MKLIKLIYLVFFVVFYCTTILAQSGTNSIEEVSTGWNLIGSLETGANVDIISD